MQSALSEVEVRPGQIAYDPDLVAPDGSSGVYYYWLDREYPFSFAARTYTLLAASMPLLADNLAFWIRNYALPHLQSDLPLFRASRINLVFDEDVFGETSFLALNPGEGYGLLRNIDPDERPNPRDVVIYEALPNSLPRVAGIITTVPQTPLSHVNLRAVQNGIPNAFIRDALDDDALDDLLGSYVHYTVTATRYSIRAATRAEVAAHYESSRPTAEQTSQRDLSVTSITPLSGIGFEDWQAFGVKAANVAVLRTLGFPTGTVPDGFAIPFYFYDEFMKANGLYTRIETMLADEDFQTDFGTQEDELKKLRKAIKDADTPAWITTALTTMHAAFPEGTSLRYRSSTNNEDLPGFNGAGLYDSKTQHPDETAEDGISKSLKQVYASLWNFRAFTEREFHRIDHRAAAMGVLVHPNYSDELVNGVAVSFDLISDLDGFGRAIREEQDLRPFLALADLPARFPNLVVGAPTVVAPSIADAPAHQVKAVAAAVLLAGREVFGADLFSRLPGLLPGRNSALDLVNDFVGDFLRVVFPALPKGFLRHSAPPFLVVAVVTRLVDLRHGAHVLVDGHSDLLRQFPRQLDRESSIQRLVKLGLVAGRGVLLAVLVLFLNHGSSLSWLSAPLTK